MATQLNIEDTHKGEPVIICLQAKNPDGTPLSFASTQEIIFTVSKTKTGDPFLQVSDAPEIVLANEVTSEWLLDIKASTLAGLQEGHTYYYNVWSRRNGDAWLQGFGRLKRLNSIEPV